MRNIHTPMAMGALARDAPAPPHAVVTVSEVQDNPAMPMDELNQPMTEEAEPHAVP